MYMFLNTCTFILIYMYLYNIRTCLQLCTPMHMQYIIYVCMCVYAIAPLCCAPSMCAHVYISRQLH